MSRPALFAAAAATALLAPAAARAQAVRSVYTELSEQTCRALTQSDGLSGQGDWSTSRCPGVLGYGLLVHYGDDRENITVRRPDGREQDLRLWDVVGSSFSSLGPRAEWRIRARSGTPHALIVRYRLADPETQGRVTSWLAVARLAGGVACVTDRVAPGPAQNQTARRLADTPGRPCFEDPA